ncbi:hypothetical protein QBC37DRAFT_451051 [Rhypophila decipiens]|uniref:Flavin-nucleotide-binding protein n=1 Tax=Rhypophila decipiens TaxID=261697 RepID=A0AAN6YEZ6_9PEZI|nr:hypothetical protein QBC37DRAFT_451051 [Rhypophila decipiens]
MPRQELQYPKQPYSTVKRLNDRANYELETIHRLINESRLVSVSFNDPDSPFPAVLPMIGVMGSFDRPSADVGDVLDLYLHGYVSSRIMNLTRRTTSSPSQDSEAAPQGGSLPLTIQTSTITGLVLALTPNHHSYNYTSATLFGHASLVTSPDEKLYAMALITNQIIPSRWEKTRVPPTPAEMSSTSILRVKISAGSAKLHSGGPSDDRFDLDNQDLTQRVWTGVVPVYTTLGEPVPGHYNQVEQVPDYLGDFVTEQNETTRKFSEHAAREEVRRKA